jgi:hypothetical protein
MEINAMFDETAFLMSDTGQLNDLVNDLLLSIDRQQDICDVPASMIPGVNFNERLESNPLFYYYYDDIQNRQNDCIDSVRQAVNEYIDILEKEGGRILQKQALYLGTSSPASGIMDSFLLFQQFVSGSRQDFEDILAGSAFDTLKFDFPPEVMDTITAAGFVNNARRAITGGERLLAQIKADISADWPMLQTIRSRMEKWIKPGEDADPKNSQEAISGIPQLIHTDDVVTPSITMVAGTKRVKGPWYNELGFFVGNSEERDRRNIQSIFNAEQSEYGFYLRGAVMEMRFLKDDYQKRWALHYSGNYLEKSINEDTVQSKPSVNFSQFQGRLAGEFIVFDNILSLYSGINWILPLTNVAMYRERLPFQKDGQPYMDFGVRMFLEPGKVLNVKDPGLGIVIDINFIVNNQDMRSVNYKGDSLVPGLRFAIQKTLSVN